MQIIYKQPKTCIITKTNSRFTETTR